MNHGGLFRVPVRDLRNPVLASRDLETAVERYSDKPLSDGLSTLQTVIKSEKIRWADGLSFGPDGWLYLADSALSEQILQTTDHVAAAGPYYIFRFQPGFTGIPGQ